MVKSCRIDPILDRRGPVLFAHRGGAGEGPESTEEAFRHAAAHAAEVLEVDVRVTRDGEIVVWHGPSLANVHNGRRFFSSHDHICDFRWSDLHGRAWVAAPQESGLIRKPERLMMTLAGFFRLVNHIDEESGPAPLSSRLAVNIELKRLKVPAPGWAGRDDRGQVIIEKLLDLVSSEAPRRRLILASTDHSRLLLIRRRLRKRSACYPTNLSWLEQAAFSEYIQDWRIRLGLGLADSLVPEKEDLTNLAFQTSHRIVGPKLVREVHRRGGSIYAFLTGFPLLPGIDHEEEEKLKPKLHRLLDSGLDGVMTDYPAKIRPWLDRWKDG